MTLSSWEKESTLSSDNVGEDSLRISDEIYPIYERRKEL